MNQWPDLMQRRQDVVAIPVLWIALVLSLLIHGALLLPYWKWPVPSKPFKELGDETQRGLAVRLLPRSVTPPPVPPQPAPRTAAPPRRTAPAVPAKPAPPIARPAPSAARPPLLESSRPGGLVVPSPPPAPPAAVAPPRPVPPQQDFMADLRARQQSRGATGGSAPTESENARMNRIVTANLDAPRAHTFGFDPNKTGGLFEIVNTNYDDAELVFRGWDEAIGRTAPQHFEVRKGNNSNMEIAVVRQVIAIIRQYEKGDFPWESRRLGREITLSARPEDTAGLEDVLMKELFSAPR